MPTYLSSYDGNGDRENMLDVPYRDRSRKLAYNVNDQEHYARRRFRQSMRATLADLTIACHDFTIAADSIRPFGGR